MSCREMHMLGMPSLGLFVGSERRLYLHLRFDAEYRLNHVCTGQWPGRQCSGLPATARRARGPRVWIVGMSRSTLPTSRHFRSVRIRTVSGGPQCTFTGPKCSGLKFEWCRCRQRRSKSLQHAQSDCIETGSTVAASVSCPPSNLPCPRPAGHRSMSTLTSTKKLEVRLMYTLNIPEPKPSLKPTGFKACAVMHQEQPKVPSLRRSNIFSGGTGRATAAADAFAAPWSPPAPARARALDSFAGFEGGRMMPVV